MKITKKQLREMISQELKEAQVEVPEEFAVSITGNIDDKFVEDLKRYISSPHNLGTWGFGNPKVSSAGSRQVVIYLQRTRKMIGKR